MIDQIDIMSLYWGNDVDIFVEKEPEETNDDILLRLMQRAVNEDIKATFGIIDEVEPCLYVRFRAVSWLKPKPTEKRKLDHLPMCGH